MLPVPLWMRVTGAFLVSAFSAWASAAPESAPERYSIRAYGAQGDGIALDTAAIQRAIDAAAGAGGGTVFVGPGDYLSGTVFLRSHVTLDLAPGAVLRAAPTERREPFTGPAPRQGYATPALIMASDCEQIAIIGRGRIVGEGLVRESVTPPNSADKAIALWNCRDVLLRDFTVFRGGHFAIFATGVDNLAIDNVTVDTERDGIDVESCRNVRISGCSVNSPFDDGICLKSGHTMAKPRATENVTITGCAVSGFDVGTLVDATWQHRTDFTREAAADAVGLARFGPQQRTRNNLGGPTGRIKFGTGSHGGFNNITITNCTFDTCRGLAVEAVDGGDIENVTVANLSLRNVYTAPIFIRLGARARTADGHVSTIRRVSLTNILVQSSDPRHGCIISGIPDHPIEDLSLSHIQIVYPGGGTAAQAARQPAELEADYPEPFMFGDMPAYGLFIRHVRRLTMTDVRVSTVGRDERPAIVLQDAAGVVLDTIRADAAPGVPLVALRRVSDVRLKSFSGIEDRVLAEPVAELNLPAIQASQPAKR